MVHYISLVMINTMSGYRCLFTYPQWWGIFLSLMNYCHSSIQPESLKVFKISLNKAYLSVSYDITLLKLVYQSSTRNIMDIATKDLIQFIALCRFYPFTKFVASIRNSLARETGLTTQTLVIMTFIRELVLLIHLGKPYFFSVDFRLQI